jgi:hypothetical protein
MVRKLGPPSRPLPTAKRVWRWNPPQPSARWRWCRVYHQNKYTPDGITFRRYGPTARFDHHHPTTTVAMFNLAAKGAGMAIGALPALSDGNEARSLTQQWARAIYEDHPAGPEITGIHYRSGYNSGQALAPWDCDADADVDVEIGPDDGGHPQDIALDDPRILPRLQVQLRRRQISITTVTSNECKKEPLGP